MTRCQSVPDFMPHHTDNSTPRPSLARLATTTAVTMWPTSPLSTTHPISAAGALPLIPQTSSHLATTPLFHTNNLGSSLEPSNYTVSPYDASTGVHSTYHQHGVDSTDSMMWSDEARMVHRMPTTPIAPKAPSFIHKPGSSHSIHVHNAPFSIATRQRELNQHKHGGNNGSSSAISSNNNNSGNNSAENKQCEQCGTTRSPEWRRGPSGHKT
jgi:hypothetical protein